MKLELSTGLVSEIGNLKVETGSGSFIDLLHDFTYDLFDENKKVNLPSVDISIEIIDKLIIGITNWMLIFFGFFKLFIQVKKKNSQNAIQEPNSKEICQEYLAEVTYTDNQSNWFENTFRFIRNRKNTAISERIKDFSKCARIQLSSIIIFLSNIYSSVKSSFRFQGFYCHHYPSYPLKGKPLARKIFP